MGFLILFNLLNRSVQMHGKELSIYAARQTVYINNEKSSKKPPKTKQKNTEMLIK